MIILMLTDYYIQEPQGSHTVLLPFSLVLKSSAFSVIFIRVIGIAFLLLGNCFLAFGLANLGSEDAKSLFVELLL